MKNWKDWMYIETINWINSKCLRYKYIGPGYFNEVVERLQDKIGKVIFINYKESIIHVTPNQGELLNETI